MQGQQHYQPQLFQTVDIEKLIPQNHLLRKIDKLIDLSFIRESTKDLYVANKGRPSIDPELFIRMLLVGYFYNIPSDRKLCEEIQFNIAYRWFCRMSLEDEVPDHSSLTKIRDRFGESVFKDFFQKIIHLCMDKGLVKGQSVMVDSTLIKADSSLDSLRKKDGSDADLKRHAVNYVKGQKIANDTHYSKTDPDCTLAGKKHQSKRLYYKEHRTIDAESRVILDSHITTGSIHESKMFVDRIKAAEENLNIKIEDVTADRAYGSGINQEFLKDKNITSYVPLFKEKTGEDHKGFTYLKDEDRYVCSQGKKLGYRCTSKDGHRYYQTHSVHCKGCPLYESCYSSSDKKMNRKRIIRHPQQEIFDEIKSRENTSVFRQKRNERMWKIEGTYAEGKNYHALDKARFRGLSKVQIQIYMSASVQNIKRLLGLEGVTFEFIFDFLTKYFGNLRLVPIF